MYDDLYNGTAAVFAEIGSSADSVYRKMRLPQDIGDYGRDVLYLKELLDELSEFYPDREEYERNMLYTELFANEVKRFRALFNLDIKSSFDKALMQRALVELNIRKKA